MSKEVLGELMADSSIQPEKTLCLIPAKGKSTRLPRKNILPFMGHPLLAHAIKKGLLSGLSGHVCVSTEDEEIAQIAKDYGAEVPFLRPDHLAVDPASIVDVCLHATDWYETKKEQQFDHLLVLLSTSPLVPMRAIKDAWNLYQKSEEQSCVLSVCQMEQPPFSSQLLSDTGYLKPAFPDSKFANMKSNECPPAFHSNGCVVIANLAWLRKHRSFYATDTKAYVMERIHSIDIDTQEDYQLALALGQTQGFYNPSESGLFDDIS